MHERLLLIACFGVGVALEALLLQRNDWRPWRLLGIALLSVFAMLPGKHERVYEPLFHVLMVFSVFAVSFALAFKEDILPAIGEKLLLSYTLIFWFAFFSYFYHPTLLCNVLLNIFMVPTLATILIAYVKIPLNFTLKLILYTWFLCIIVTLGLFQFPFYQLKLFFHTQEVPWVSPLESICAGMAFLYLAANATYIFYLIPIQGKNESWEQRMQRWHEFTNLMTQRFDADASLSGATEIFLFAEFIVLVLDYFFRWLPRGLLINLLIVLPGLLLFYVRRSYPSPALNPSLPSDAESWSRSGSGSSSAGPRW